MADKVSMRTRLTVDVSPELRRRIKIAAAERDLSLRDYVVSILEQAVVAAGRRPRGRVVTQEMIDRFAQLRARQPHTFTDDSTDLINEGRLERTAEL